MTREPLRTKAQVAEDLIHGIFKDIAKIKKSWGKVSNTLDFAAAVSLDHGDMKSYDLYADIWADVEDAKSAFSVLKSRLDQTMEMLETAKGKVVR